MCACVLFGCNICSELRPEVSRSHTTIWSVAIRNKTAPRKMKFTQFHKFKIMYVSSRNLWMSLGKSSLWVKQSLAPQLKHHNGKIRLNLLLNRPVNRDILVIPIECLNICNSYICGCVWVDRVVELQSALAGIENKLFRINRMIQQRANMCSCHCTFATW